MKIGQVITALEHTYRDAEGDLLFHPTEKTELQGLAAAVTLTVPCTRVARLPSLVDPLDRQGIPARGYLEAAEA